MSLAEVLVELPIDLQAVRAALVELADLPDDDARAAIVEARRAVRFEGDLRRWHYQQQTIRLAGALIDLSPGVRRAVVLQRL